jgi:predicted nucleotidyltransferase
MNTRVANIISNIATEFHHIFDVNTSLLLFSSRTNNTASQYSDVDLLIDSKGKLDKGKLLEFKDFIDDFPTLYGIDLMGMNIAIMHNKKR